MRCFLSHSVNGYKGGLSHPCSFVGATVPECLPDRFELLSYANEYSFLYDDPTRATVTMKVWAAFVQSASRIRTTHSQTLEEYVPARVIDSGELFWFGLLTSGMALTTPEEEYHLCMELAKSAYAALGLTNGLYSWEKERDAAKRAGQYYVFYAIWVIMKERSVGEEEAKFICCTETQKWTSLYCCVVHETKNNLSLSRDLRAYLEALLYSYVGNLVWCITCPRYQ
ncbi:isoprenoid synthase domain-containing protein [Halenospora varia]|nr:isoprenoid synthase domain-containing protein [Halenospora varia]